MIKIKNCPFCGGEAKTFHIPENTEEENKKHPLWNWNHPGMWVIGCDTPLCFGNINHKAMLFFDEESAVEIWNKRKKLNGEPPEAQAVPSGMIEAARNGEVYL